MTQYDATEVRISTRRWVSRCAFAALFIVIGLVTLIAGVTSGDPDSGRVWIGIGALMASTGAYALYKWRRPYDLELTERGKAEQEKAEQLAKEGAAKSDAAFAKFFFPVAFIAVLIYSSDSIFDALEGKVRVYTIVCASKLNSELRCPADGWKAGFVTSYSVYPNQQVVVGDTLDTNVRPFKLFNCAVVDRTNWTCSTGPEIDAPRITLRKGEAAEEMSTSTLQFVPRLRWWIVKLQDGSLFK